MYIIHDNVVKRKTLYKSKDGGGDGGGGTTSHNNTHTHKPKYKIPLISFSEQVAYYMPLLCMFLCVYCACVTENVFEHIHSHTHDRFAILLFSMCFLIVCALTVTMCLTTNMPKFVCAYAQARVCVHL